MNKFSKIAIAAALAFGVSSAAFAGSGVGAGGAAGVGLGATTSSISGTAQASQGGSSLSQSYNNQSVSITLAPASTGAQGTSINGMAGTQTVNSFTGSVQTNSSGGVINQSTGNGTGIANSSGTAIGGVIGASGAAYLGTSSDGSIQGGAGLVVGEAAVQTGNNLQATTNLAGSNGAQGNAGVSNSVTYGFTPGSASDPSITSSISTTNSGYSQVQTVDNSNFVNFSDGKGGSTATYGNGYGAAGVNNVSGTGSYAGQSAAIDGAGIVDLTTMNH